VTRSLLLHSPADASDLVAFLGRAVRLDAGALVRVRGEGGTVRVWCNLPTGVLVTRAVRGTAPADVTVSAAALLAATPQPPNRTSAEAGQHTPADPRVFPESANSRELIAPLPVGRDPEWRGALPAAGHGRVLDTVPADVIGSLLTAAERAFRQASASADPQSVGDALLAQDVLTVSSGGTSAAVPLKGLLSLARMGFLGADQAGAGGPIRVAIIGGWIRLAAAYGDAYLRRGDQLGLFPAT
jgi:hypothetical protein